MAEDSEFLSDDTADADTMLARQPFGCVEVTSDDAPEVKFKVALSEA